MQGSNKVVGGAERQIRHSDPFDPSKSAATGGRAAGTSPSANSSSGIGSVDS